MRGRRALRKTAILIALPSAALSLACGVILGGDESPSPNPNTDAALDPDAPGVVDDGGGASVVDGAAGDSDVACRKPGPLVVDPAFATNNVPVTIPMMAVDSAQRIVTVGRANCGVGGEQRLSMHRLLPNGTVDTPSPCFGEELEVPRSIVATANGYVLLTSVGSGPTRARVRRIAYDGNGLFTGTTTSLSYRPNFALEIPNAAAAPQLVWGGYLNPPLASPTAVLGVATSQFLSAGPSFIDEHAVTAAVEGPDLYVAFVTQPQTADPSELILRRYSLPTTTLLEDTPYSNAGRTRLTLPPSAGPFDGLGSMLVQSGVVTVAMPVGPVVTVFRFDTAWTTVKQLVGASANPHLVMACDDVLVVGHGGPQRLSRLEPTGDVSSLPLVNPNASIAGIARAPSGSLVVLQGQQLLRTLP